MNDRKRKGLWQIGAGAILLIVAFGAYLLSPKAPVTTFAECVKRGYPVMESYPRQCRTKDGQTFKEDIGNELEKDALIRISSPRPNTKVTSPLSVTGVARGNWFFEASFPVRLFDSKGNELAVGIAQANSPAGGEWMTSEFVPFEATVYFTRPSSDTGVLILEKDNPSGLPEHADALRVPVMFR